MRTDSESGAARWLRTPNFMKQNPSESDSRSPSEENSCFLEPCYISGPYSEQSESSLQFPTLIPNDPY
jgi:hypothetical protein